VLQRLYERTAFVLPHDLVAHSRRAAENRRTTASVVSS
jgi:hypothetical protein